MVEATGTVVVVEGPGVIIDTNIFVVRPGIHKDIVTLGRSTTLF